MQKLPVNKATVLVYVDIDWISFSAYNASDFKAIYQRRQPVKEILKKYIHDTTIKVKQDPGTDNLQQRVNATAPSLLIFGILLLTQTSTPAGGKKKGNR